MTNTFTREDLASPTTDETVDEPTETADEIADEAEAEPVAARASTPVASVEDLEDDFGEPTADEPMPDMADPDIQFDTDKYRTKMARHVAVQAERAVARVRTRKRIEEKVARFAKDHPDFEQVVNKNPVLAANQLGPDAAVTVARSPYTAELLYRFGKDNELAVRVAKMSPAQQVLTVVNMIRDIKDEKRAATTARPQRQTARKGPASREEQLAAKDSMTTFAATSRGSRFAGRFYK